MAVASSLQLSHELGLPKNLKHTSKLKKLDALNFRLLDSVNRQNCSLPSRYNVFVCQSSILPIRASEIPILKTAATALTRSFNASHGNPFVLKLVPGLVIIFFTVWGLGPLMRHGRNFFLKRGDNSWKRSGTHYVTTSYLQPLLLWSGATLVCRALDPVVLSSAASESVKRRLLVFVRSMSTVLAFAHCLSSLIQQVQQFLMETNDPTDTRNMGYQFAGKAVYSAVWVAAVSLFMELLGFSTQKMLTAGGLGTVLLTLAGREIFTNFLSSMMIHATRPFVLNEWIQTKIQGYEVSGTVEHVGWWSPTIIRGDDREAVHIPNHKFTVNVVRNLSQKTHWRIKNHFSISHLDVNKINVRSGQHIVADMRKVVAKNPQIEQQRLHRRVFLERIDPENQALVILVSCFVKTSRIEEYMCVKEVILLDLLRVISHHRARLATPIRTVHKMNSDEDMENIPFSETIFTHATEATNRPFLLIEPPYKINGDDKTKVHTRSARGNDEQDTKVTSTPTEYSTTPMPPDLKEDTHLEETASGSKADYEAIKMSQSEFDDTTVATTSTTSDPKADSKSAATLLESNRQISKSMADNKVAATVDRRAVATSSESKLDPEVAATPQAGPANHGSSSADEEKDTKQKDMPLEKLSSAPSTTPQLDPTEVNSRGTILLKAAFRKPEVSPSEHGSEVQDGPTAASQDKQETEKLPTPPSPQARSTLEDNLVLGVALDGSKRTLPIEEGATPPSPAEMKKMAACGTSSGSPAAKDKEGHALTTPGDQER